MKPGTEDNRIDWKLRFIFHSSYLLELPDAYILFDYYQGDLPELDGTKRLYVMASHAHYDHFSPVVFQLIRKYPGTTYILSDDISQRQCEEAISEMGIDPPEILWIRPGIEYTLPEFRVEAFRSTDQGVSFLIEAGGRRFLHAGDLNDWCWQNVQKSRNEKMQAAYLAALKELKEILGDTGLDVAIIPMDPVLGKKMYQGPLEFLETIPVRSVYPMHMWERYSVGESFLSEYPEYLGTFHPVHHAGEDFH
ncbi:MAG: MBL fold metallo-hydrolase [Eubacterium sp.]|nr:MBL fold metallo-hydrolase [Eubacterium sp.]